MTHPASSQAQPVPVSTQAQINQPQQSQQTIQAPQQVQPTQSQLQAPQQNPTVVKQQQQQQQQQPPPQQQQQQVGFEFNQKQLFSLFSDLFPIFYAIFSNSCYSHLNSLNRSLPLVIQWHHLLNHSLSKHPHNR